MNNNNDELATVTAARDAAFAKYAEAKLAYEAALADWVAEYERAMSGSLAKSDRWKRVFEEVYAAR